MALWNDFLQGGLPYQQLWLPLIIGVAVGMLCVFMGISLVRPKKRPVVPILPTITTHDPAVHDSVVHDPFVQGSAAEQRKSVRRGGNLVQVLYADPQDRKATRHALVLDRSMGGLRLAAKEKIAADTRLVVLPVNASEQVPWIEIDVRTCCQVDDGWELGCQFVKTPQWSILLLFG